MSLPNGGVGGDPQELARFLVSRGNARDVEGLVALCEPGAVVAWEIGEQQSALVRFGRKQPDGTWLWIIDQP
jgi:hypothetical protein